MTSLARALRRMREALGFFQQDAQSSVHVCFYPVGDNYSCFSREVLGIIEGVLALAPILSLQHIRALIIAAIPDGAL